LARTVFRAMYLTISNSRGFASTVCGANGESEGEKLLVIGGTSGISEGWITDPESRSGAAALRAGVDR
jgi:hypothetical protein